MFTRRALCAFILCFVTLPVLAQTAKPAPPSAAQPTPDDRAKQWLSLADDGNFAEAARQMGPGAQRDAVKLRDEREPMGAMANRNLKDVQLSTRQPGLPKGQYAVVRYDTSFARKATAVETVTLGMNGGAWSVVSYRIDGAGH